MRTLADRDDLLGNRTDTALPDGRALSWLFCGSDHLHQINIAQPGHQVIADIERDALHRELVRSQRHLASRY